jgi:hypothetical protein
LIPSLIAGPDSGRAQRKDSYDNNQRTAWPQDPTPPDP